MKVPVATPVTDTSNLPPSALPLPTGGGLNEPLAKPDPEAVPPEAGGTPAVISGKREPTASAKPDAVFYPALQSLKQFLAAPTWKERQRWSQKEESIGPVMESYYRAHPDGPVDVERIEFIQHYPSRKGLPAYTMFEMTGGSLKQTTLALVEEPSSGPPRVDWEAFVEFKDHLLWQFLLKPSSTPQRFRVLVRRKHAFDKNIPDIELKDSFELTQPGSDAASLVYATRGSEASRLLGQQLAWGSVLPAIVELTWRNEGTKRWVEIRSLPAFGWRG
jgi:hypothetical protein